MSRANQLAKVLCVSGLTLALVETIDSVAYSVLGEGLGANPMLIVLTGLGVAGCLAAFIVRTPLAVGLGGLLVAVAPAIAYPLSFLLGVVSVLVLVIGARTGTLVSRRGSNRVGVE